MAEDRKLDERIAPRAPRAASEAAAFFEEQDGKPLAHGDGADGAATSREGLDGMSCIGIGEADRATALREEGAATVCSNGADGHVANAPRAKRDPLSAAQKAGVGIAAALSVALIAVSAYFAATSAAEGPQVGGLLATTLEVEASDAADDPADPQEPAAPGVDEGAAAGESEGTAEADPEPAGVSAAGAAAPGAEPPTAGAPASPSAPAQPATVTVSVTVDSSAADGRVSGGANPTFEQGATVYDALMACGLSVNASSTPLGIYVSAIGGLAEKEYPGESGWKYSVNGEVIMRSCDSIVLQDGDVVRWFYSR